MAGGINSVVYVAAGNSITYFNMSDSSKKTLDWGNEAHINALDGNSRAEKLYFTDLKYKRIMTSDLDGTNEKVVRMLFNFKCTAFKLWLLIVAEYVKKIFVT